MTVKGFAVPMKSPTFGHAEPLPRGPHELSREQVAASQRARLFAAIAELMARQGYASVNIADLVALAGVSRATFYQHFADKEQCLLAAYEQYAQTLMDSLVPLLAENVSTLRGFIENLISSYIEVIKRDPESARAFFVEMDGAGARARARRRHERQAFVALFEIRHAEFRRRDSTLGPLPRLAYEVIIDAATEIVRDRLDTDSASDLDAVIPDLATAFTAMLEGA